MKKKKNTPLKTVFTISGGMLLVFLLSHINYFLYAGLLIGTVGIFSDYLAALIEKLWMKLAHAMNFISSPIILSIIFYLFLFPVSLLSKLFKKSDPLILSGKVKSTFIDVSKKFDPKSFEKPW